MMTYPETPGYQHGSDTSRHAADTLTTAHKNRQILLDLLKRRGLEGCTIDEFAQALGVPPNAISGRFSELETDGKICKTPQRRKTRSGKPAVVYLLGSWVDNVLPQARIAPPPPQESLVKKYRAIQAVHGHGHVIARNDGRREGCGGPGICRICRQAKNYFTAMEEKERIDGL